MLKYLGFAPGHTNDREAAAITARARDYRAASPLLPDKTDNTVKRNRRTTCCCGAEHVRMHQNVAETASTTPRGACKILSIDRTQDTIG